MNDLIGQLIGIVGFSLGLLFGGLLVFGVVMVCDWWKNRKVRPHGHAHTCFTGNTLKAKANHEQADNDTLTE